MVEPIQGEGGVHPLSKEFFEGVGQYAKDHDILLIVDEVQTGNGRTGKLYGYMNYDVEPDIVSTAKGIGGGLPLGVTMFNEKTENVYTPAPTVPPSAATPLPAPVPFPLWKESMMLF